MMTDDSTDISRYGSVIGSSDLGKEDHSSDQFDFESVGESAATENETADGDSDTHTSPNHPVVKVKTLVEYHLEFLTKHPGEVFFYGCRLCPNRFTSRNSFLIHMKLHDVRKRYPCQHCDKAYDRKFQLVHHLRLHTEETPFECAVCFAAYATEPELARHAAVHRGHKPFECRFCLKGFPQKKALIVHLRMHTGERPFPCQFCDRTFTQKAHLQGHMVRIHIPKNKVEYQKGGEMHQASDKAVLSNIFSQNITSQHLKHNSEITIDPMPSEIDLSILSGQREKLIECDFCDKKFTYERNKTNHMKKHGYGETPPSQLECGACPLTFPSRGLLAAHSLTHSATPNLNNTSPFRCDICGREFNMKRNLIMHVKSHNNERPFECPACEKSFKLKYFLELHVTRIHPYVRLEDLPKKKAPSPVFTQRNNVAADVVRAPVTPNKRKQSQPKKVIMRTDEFESESDSSYGEYSSESEGGRGKGTAEDMEMDSEPFDAAKFVQVFVNEPRGLVARREERGVAKSMQINLPHDLQHVKSLLGCKGASPEPGRPRAGPLVPAAPSLPPSVPQGHERGRPHQCTMCEKVYIQQASFEKHMKRHALDEIAARQTRMIEQATARRPEERKPLECSVCRKKYAQPASFEKHMRQHSEAGGALREPPPGDDGFKAKSTENSDTADAFINPSDFLEVSIEH